MKPLALVTYLVLGVPIVLVGLAGSEALATVLGLPKFTGMTVFALVAGASVTKFAVEIR